MSYTRTINAHFLQCVTSIKNKHFLQRVDASFNRNSQIQAPRETRGRVEGIGPFPLFHKNRCLAGGVEGGFSSICKSPRTLALQWVGGDGQVAWGFTRVTWKKTTANGFFVLHFTPRRGATPRLSIE
ncbi:hypothetical protein CDAR_464131 [Caerostris darwini]|uniref:Uncharacterized protein n=1 Tax=Caerostris darwini TaxID=1538125 RepID=A0AAV4VV14_9ARAC|nr:hypothetical protein CDAR_464131 [Caerostris darwini]